MANARPLKLPSRPTGIAYVVQRKNLPVLALAVVALVIAGLIARDAFFPPSSTTSAGLRTATVATGTVTNTVTATGTLVPAQSMTLGFKTAGTLTAVEVHVGDHVNSGQLLATIDQAPLQVALQSAQATLASAKLAGYQALHEEHIAEWAKYWHDSDVVIDGDELAQRAIRFTTYHVLIAAPRHDEHASIGAKTLSGPGYKGHVFWDTELFILPVLTLTQPRIARNLLMYRYHTLQGARNKAKEGGYEGAMYPWEATDTGEETTPRWTNPMPDGSRIRIWTGDSEQHISSDIAYAILQYWRWTDDTEFFVHYGAEIVLDTAVFWGSRVEYNADEGRYELSQQIGPDEYHENINTSAFTNSIVRWHLQQALDVLGWLRLNYAQQASTLVDKLQLTSVRLEKWHDVIARMYIPRDVARGVLEQFDGFFKLEPFDMTPWQPRVTNMDAILGHEPTQHVAVIKQADIVMLTALLPDAVGDDDAKRRNWAIYSKIVDHGSSLSPAMHAWVAARLGLTDEAYDLYIHGATIDLEDNKGNVRDGIHAAAAGGLWQATVFGFAGLKSAVMVNSADEGITLDPQLPDGWRSVQFRIFRHGVQRTIRLTAE